MHLRRTFRAAEFRLGLSECAGSPCWVLRGELRILVLKHGVIIDRPFFPVDCLGGVAGLAAKFDKEEPAAATGVKDVRATFAEVIRDSAHGRREAPVTGYALRVMGRREAPDTG